MILAHEHPLGVSEYHRSVDPQSAAEPNAQGLVLTVGIQFERWLDNRRIKAEAFVDPGADRTMLSMRWLQGVADREGCYTRPLLSNRGVIREGISLEIAGKKLNPNDSIGLGMQEKDDRVEGLQLPWIPGLEDMLLGRDVLTRHGLLLLVDGAGHCFSLLSPCDDENRDRRGRIRSAFDPAA